MPKFLELHGWRFFAVMFDLLNEPFHIHVTVKGKKECKYWITSGGICQFAFNRGFTRHKLRKIEKAISTHLVTIIDQYQTHCYANSIEPSCKVLD